MRTADGGVHVHRFIPAMGHSDFVLSPYVASNAGFRALFGGQPAPAGPTVTSLRISAESSGALPSWSEHYTLRLRSVTVAP